MNDPEIKKILEEGIHEKKDDLETCIALSGKIVIANREFPAPTAGVLAMLEQIQSPFIAEGNGKVEQLDILRALYLLSEREKALLPILRIRHLETQLEAIPEPSDAAALFVLIEQRKKLADAEAEFDAARCVSASRSGHLMWRKRQTISERISRSLPDLKCCRIRKRDQKKSPVGSRSPDHAGRHHRPHDSDPDSP